MWHEWFESCLTSCLTCWLASASELMGCRNSSWGEMGLRATKPPLVLWGGGGEKSIQQTQAKAECTETNLHTFADSQGRASTVGHQRQRLGVGQNVLWERGGVQTLKHQITLLKQVSTTHKTDLFAKKGLHSLKKAIFVSELTWASSCCLSFLALFCLK